MTTCNPGDVVLVRFPFTDLTTTKQRPSVVISPPEFGHRQDDVVVLALTSKPQDDDALRLSEWKTCGLLKPTWVKPLLATISQQIVVKRLGTIHEQDIKCAVHAVRLLVDEPFRSGTSDER